MQGCHINHGSGRDHHRGRGCDSMKKHRICMWKENCEKKKNIIPCKSHREVKGQKKIWWLQALDIFLYI